MKRTAGFDLLNDPLSGANLVEAGAGTGKTYTITGLFLRLVVEKRLPVGKILVVTFTEAATQELRDRIRGALREALGVFCGERTADAFLAAMAEKHRDTRTASMDLEEALRAFDQASIFTIHGFCRRMLRDNAFESGGLFDTELIADQGDIIRDIVLDYWRQHFYDASPLFVHYAISTKVSPDTLVGLLTSRITLPYLKIIPRVDTPDTASEEQCFLIRLEAARSLWNTSKSEVVDILSRDENLDRSKYRYASIPGWVEHMDDWLCSQGSRSLLFEAFDKFTNAGLAQGVKKGCLPPSHDFFDLCDKLKQAQEKLAAVFDQRLLSLKKGLFDYARKELGARKKDRNIQFFDDLLYGLHGALNHKVGDALGRAVRARFQAALIDEFQDTDPIQYDIFKRLFGGDQSILFLIGDPKQAIYGFRSADIFTYMKAVDDVTSCYTLDKNWRSVPDLIGAVNALFSGVRHPFVYEKIPFQAAIPARNKDSETLQINGKTDAPFYLWFVGSAQVTGADKPIPKGQAREWIATSVAGEIARLLRLGKNNQALLGDRPLSAEDIAVLVRRNTDARLMKEVLFAFNIPSVLHSTGNLFDTRDALEVERVLAGIVRPSDEGLLKIALATDMMGVKGESLDALFQDETGWEARIVRFRRYHDLWRKKGFIQMFRCLLFDDKVIARLMALPDGERRATNVLHLSEVLHQVSIQRQLGMAGVEKWLAEQRDPNAPRLEEHQLRLESDDQAVRIVTIHKSKGLEYPIVFCPFCWDGTRIKNKKEPFTFHHEAHDMQLTLDLGSEFKDRHRIWAEKEALAEQLRVLYVALTRARNRCYMIWGRFNEAETSAPAYLFHQPPSPWKDGDVARATAERFAALSDEQMIKDLSTVVTRAKGAVTLCDMPGQKSKALEPSVIEGQGLGCRRFSGHIDRSWQVASFSSLTARERYHSALPYGDARMSGKDYEDKFPEDIRMEGASIKEASSGETAPDIFAFPRGAKAGNLVHGIFEELDFGCEDSSHLETLVADKLSAFGFEALWQEALCRMIRNVLSVPLDAGHETFRLAGVGKKDRLTEMGFYFPLKGISSEALNSLPAAHAGTHYGLDWSEQMGRLDFSPARGFVKGYVDLVFRFEDRYYLADWKTNFLGDRVEDYGPEALGAAMTRGNYVLQYLLYSVALHQYLRLRLPGYAYNKYFGGVYYLFVRGVDPGKGSHYGVFHDRPSEELIDALSKALIGGP
jgi:exodeoxyribonuclease V beta subunit